MSKSLRGRVPCFKCGEPAMPSQKVCSPCQNEYQKRSVKRKAERERLTLAHGFDIRLERAAWDDMIANQRKLLAGIDAGKKIADRRELMAIAVAGLDVMDEIYTNCEALAELYPGRKE